MSSTVFGVIVGVVIAAVVTTQYGDGWAHTVRGWLPEELPVEPAEQRAPEQLPVEPAEQRTPLLPEPTPPAPLAMPEAETTTEVSQAPSQDILPETDGVVPELESAPRQAEEPGLEQRWARYRAQSDQLLPQGSFPWRVCFTRAAAAYDVPEALLLAVASGESGFDPAARSDSDAIGLMQIRWPDTSHHLGVRREADLYDPCTNVAAGARYLAELNERFDEDLHRAVAAYNYGPGAIAAGPMPAGAAWYSGYIYQHLTTVLGGETSAVSPPPGGAGSQVLFRFKQPYRAREIIEFIDSQVPGLRLDQRSEALGQHEVVLLYEDESERLRALNLLSAAGLAAPGRTIGSRSTF